MSFVYDRDRLLALMKNFHIITGIKTVVYDHDLKVIAAVPEKECAFCTALGEVAESLQRCCESTAEGCRLSKARGGLNIYKCHAGLIEAVVPIYIEDVIVGYMMLGQVLAREDQEARGKEIIQYAEKYIGKDAERCFSELICKSDEEIRAAAKLMKSCICDLLMNRAIKERSGKAAFEITRYIQAHLSEDLSAYAISRQFNISRNTLYRISNAYLGMPIAEYVRKKRIERAEQLIREGMPVTRVAEKLCFSDYGYFGKVFKKITQKTPTEVAKED